jgi:hypothetical protein
MTEKDFSEDVISDIDQQEQNNSLPEGVTEEPRNDEEMDLGLIKDSSSLIEVYLAVSDDEGELLGDKVLEKEVTDFIEQYQQIKVEEIGNLDAVLNALRGLYKGYSKKINTADSISSGTITKYLIRQGMLLNIEKRLTKASNKQWIDHFAETYGRKHLRSAQDYMALARIPNIIRYAVYGKERLVEIVRAVKALKLSGDDTIASFLDKHNIHYNPEDNETEESLAELKIEIDAAIAMTKIKKIEEERQYTLGVRVDLIKKLIGLGIRIENGIIGDMVIVKESSGDVNQHLENVYIMGGQGNSLVRPTKKVQGFPKLVASFKTTVDYIRDHADLAERIDSNKIEELERYITDLKSLIGNPSNDN